MGDDLDAKITSVPGLDSFLRRRDLPGFCRADNLANYAIQLALRSSKSLELMDSSSTHLGARRTNTGSNTYVNGPAYGNWHGLANSGRRFLWVRRPGSIVEREADLKILAQLLKITKERGFIVGWAPQEEVLAHPAIGAFLTHSGWNSTLESIAEGVPRVCLPCFLDQQVISRFVSEVWKLGCDMKDTCDRVIIENVVRTVMEVRRDEFMQSADEMKKSARESACNGGS
ncbi:hypothetical protein RJ639_043663 [Escallonia herrerae]|uniref:UDP-glycosyltransferases domain-containing protein n=1 Tax=Escallonia herrerae TaxID=1293975 RepID=A0AA88WBU8_9ASTE|nr:hypothetical protein RJ639_043663 [Escallonia herrerae]